MKNWLKFSITRLFFIIIILTCEGRASNGIFEGSPDEHDSKHLLGTSLITSAWTSSYLNAGHDFKNSVQKGMTVGFIAGFTWEVLDWTYSKSGITNLDNILDRRGFSTRDLMLDATGCIISGALTGIVNFWIKPKKKNANFYI